MWWNDHMNGSSWVWGSLMMAFFWGLVVVFVLSLRGPERSSPARRDRRSAEEVLAHRLAIGEIDIDEYHARLEALTGRSSSTAPGGSDRPIRSVIEPPQPVTASTNDHEGSRHD